MSDEQSVVDLSRLYDMLMESGQQLMQEVAQGNGELTADELREILVDITNNYEDHEVAVAILMRSHVPEPDVLHGLHYAI